MAHSKRSVPHAQTALSNMKFEIATDLGVPLDQSHNGKLNARDAGSVGGEMVKRMIASIENGYAANNPSY